MKRKRHLSAEERALWDMVAGRTEPLKPGKPQLDRPLPKTVSPPSAPRISAMPSFTVGEKAVTGSGHDLSAGLSQHIRSAPVRMDQKAFGRMKRGKLKPEARIDLHGMTVAQAHPALTGFILRSASAGHRLVLVITGKGKDRDDGGPIPTKFGVLRHQVPQWLSMPPLGTLVLQVTEAHVRHGGGGAYYVYLRRAR